MKKQIRSSVFETNSSSTHSFTIEKNMNKSLVDQGVLNYINLDKLVYKTSENGDWALYCETYEKKFSLIIHTVLNLDCTEEIKNNLLSILKEKCKYYVTFVHVDSDFSMFDEYYGTPFEECENLVDFQKVLYDLIDKSEDDTIIFKEIFTIW